MQNLDHNIGSWEKRQFFAENCRKSQKIVIITSTPDAHLIKHHFGRFFFFWKYFHRKMAVLTHNTYIHLHTHANLIMQIEIILRETPSFRLQLEN
jgi:hypothetical protein